jgi:hypothetical protein
MFGETMKDEFTGAFLLADFEAKLLESFRCVNSFSRKSNKYKQESAT